MKQKLDRIHDFVIICHENDAEKAKDIILSKLIEIDLNGCIIPDGLPISTSIVSGIQDVVKNSLVVLAFVTETFNNNLSGIRDFAFEISKMKTVESKTGEAGSNLIIVLAEPNIKCHGWFHTSPLDLQDSSAIEKLSNHIKQLKEKYRENFTKHLMLTTEGKILIKEELQKVIQEKEEKSEFLKEMYNSINYVASTENSNENFTPSAPPQLKEFTNDLKEPNAFIHPKQNELPDEEKDEYHWRSRDCDCPPTIYNVYINNSTDIKIGPIVDDQN